MVALCSACMPYRRLLKCPYLPPSFTPNVPRASSKRMKRTSCTDGLMCLYCPPVECMMHEGCCSNQLGGRGEHCGRHGEERILPDDSVRSLMARRSPALNDYRAACRLSIDCFQGALYEDFRAAVAAGSLDHLASRECFPYKAAPGRTQECAKADACPNQVPEGKCMCASTASQRCLLLANMPSAVRS
jgi:hypothetical protein